MSEMNQRINTDTVTHQQRIPGNPYQEPRQLAKNSGLAEYYIRSLYKQGILPGFHIGKKFMVDVVRFEEYLDTLSK